MSMLPSKHMSRSKITNDTTYIILGLLLDANGIQRDYNGKNENPLKHLKLSIQAVLTVYRASYAGNYLIVSVYPLCFAVLMFDHKRFRYPGFPKV